MITVTDVKQYMYCPRIIYFTYCMPVLTMDTYKMKHGKEEHQRNDELEPRRTLQRYGLETGEKKYKVRLVSHRLGLKGKMDLLVIQDDNYIPIELKYSTKEPSLNHKYQLGAYCLLIEDQYETTIRKGLIHLLPKKETFEVKVTPKFRGKVREIIGEIEEVIREEIMPRPTKERGKCQDCEYRNYCGDV